VESLQVYFIEKAERRIKGFEGREERKYKDTV
jgi:hypothetical protein